MLFIPHKSLLNRKHFSTGYCSSLDSTFFTSLGVLERCHWIQTVANLSPKQRNMQSFSRHVETSPCSWNGLSAHLHPFTRCCLLEATLSSDFSCISSDLNWCQETQELSACLLGTLIHSPQLFTRCEVFPSLTLSFSLKKKKKKKKLSVFQKVWAADLCVL